MLKGNEKNKGGGWLASMEGSLRSSGEGYYGTHDERNTQQLRFSLRKSVFTWTLAIVIILSAVHRSL